MMAGGGCTAIQLDFDAHDSGAPDGDDDADAAPDAEGGIADPDAGDDGGGESDGNDDLEPDGTFDAEGGSDDDGESDAPFKEGGEAGFEDSGFAD